MNILAFNKKYILFVFINFLLVAFYISIIFIFFNIPHGIPYKMLTIAFICALLIIVAQYRVLKLAKSWLLKILLFFISMNLFLFLYGESLCFVDECIGDFPGLKMVIMGNIFGGAIIGFIIITSINYIFRKKLF